MFDEECPPPRILAAFSIGYLPVSEVDAVAGHLEACSTCIRTLDLMEREPEGALGVLREEGKDQDGSGSLFVDKIKNYRLQKDMGEQTAVPANPSPFHDFAEGARTKTSVETKSFRSPGEGRLGDFLLVREIGRGGMGVVYEAIQESLGRRVAL